MVVAMVIFAPKDPVALIQVVDSAGRPVAGVRVKPEGLRIKPGPYSGGWYTWDEKRLGVSVQAQISDTAGFVRIPYPKYVVEELETGVLCLHSSHPEFVPARPERTVDTALPAGAPLAQRLQQIWDRIRSRSILVKAPPIVMERGSILEVTALLDDTIPTNAVVFAQISSELYAVENFWRPAGRSSLVTRQLAAGTNTVRLAVLDPGGRAWFSEVVSIAAQVGETNSVALPVRPGVAIRGELDPSVPRPIKNGRVVFQVTPSGHNPKDDPPGWHAWGSMLPDGTFNVSGMPPGDVEIVAMCDGFVSTNAIPGAGMWHPQTHVIGAEDLVVTIGMERTARLEVTVNDDQGRPLPGAHVATWPNVQYGKWAASILMSDCYMTSDALLQGPKYFESRARWESPFTVVSDSNGVAVLANLPTIADELAVEHPKFRLPVATPTSGAGQKNRSYSYSLKSGETNRVAVHLEPIEASVIRHY